MPFDGVVIGLDLAGLSGVAEGCPGEKPNLTIKRFRKPQDAHHETFGRAIGWIADRLTAPRHIAGRFYGPGEAIEAGLLRVAIEAPIMTFTSGDTNADALLVTKGLWACVSGFAHRRGAMVMHASVSTIRKGFIGNGRVPGATAKREAKRICHALGWEPPNLDAADAAAVWWHACSQWAPERTPDVRPLFLQHGRAA